MSISQSSVPTTGGWACAKCGLLNRPTAERCVCGHGSLSGPEAVTAQSKPKSRFSWGIIVVTGLMVLNMIPVFFRLSDAASDLQLIWVCAIFTGILLAWVWLRSDRHRLPRNRIARFIGGLLYWMGVGALCYMLPLDYISRGTNVRSSGAVFEAVFSFVLLGGSYLLSFGRHYVAGEDDAP